MTNKKKEIYTYFPNTPAFPVRIDIKTNDVDAKYHGMFMVANDTMNLTGNMLDIIANRYIFEYPKIVFLMVVDSYNYYGPHKRYRIFNIQPHVDDTTCELLTQLRDIFNSTVFRINNNHKSMSTIITSIINSPYNFIDIITDIDFLMNVSFTESNDMEFNNVVQKITTLSISSKLTFNNFDVLGNKTLRDLKISISMDASYNKDNTDIKS